VKSASLVFAAKTFFEIGIWIWIVLITVTHPAAMRGGLIVEERMNGFVD